MKLSKLAIAIGASVSLLLAGCDAPTTYTPEQVNSATRTTLNQEDTELKQALAEARAKDPSVKDMYYSVNDKGEKELNIIREVKDPVTGQTNASSDIWPVLAGAGVGMIVGNMLAGGGYNKGAPLYSKTRSYEDERRRKNEVAAGYAGYVRSNTVRSFTSKSNSYKPSWSSNTSSSRVSGAFSSSGSSARASSYSGGG